MPPNTGCGGCPSSKGKDRQQRYALQSRVPRRAGGRGDFSATDGVSQQDSRLQRQISAGWAGRISGRDIDAEHTAIMQYALNRDVDRTAALIVEHFVTTAHDLFAQHFKPKRRDEPPTSCASPLVAAGTETECVPPSERAPEEVREAQDEDCMNLKLPTGKLHRRQPAARCAHLPHADTTRLQEGHAV